MSSSRKILDYFFQMWGHKHSNNKTYWSYGDRVIQKIWRSE